MPICPNIFNYTPENKSGQLFFERGKFDYTWSAKHAVLAHGTSAHLKSLCICIRKLGYLLKQHNSANYQLNSHHAISAFRLFDLLSLSHQTSCLLINTMTVYFFGFTVYRSYTASLAYLH
jgi:hypothetical protein